MQKKEQVVLGVDIPGLGKRGAMTKVPLGYFRNYLRPKALAYPATENYLKCVITATLPVTDLRATYCAPSYRGIS